MLVIAIIVITIVLVNMLNDKSTKKEKSKYQVMAEEFIDAIKSEDDLQEFLNKYCDYKALYAYDKATTINPEDMDEFVGKAPQFDDVTMLAFKYYGPNGGE